MTRVTLDSNIYLSALVFGGKPMRLLEWQSVGSGGGVRACCDY